MQKKPRISIFKMEKAIISGVSEGLGYEIAKLFIENNIEVVGISRKTPDLNIKHIKLDLTNYDDLEKGINIIKKEHSDFDILINCAGVLNVVELEELNIMQTDNLFKVNILSPLILTSKLISIIKKNEADIVNISSTVGLKAYEKQLAYGASKWAVRGMTKNLQLELKKTKCRVIGFNPGGFKSKIFEKATGIKTELGDDWMEPKELAKLILQILKLPKNMEVSEITVNRK